MLPERVSSEIAQLYNPQTPSMAPTVWKQYPSSLALLSEGCDLNLSFITLTLARRFPFPNGNYFLIILDPDPCHLLVIIS